MTQINPEQPLCCPLCGSEEYLLSETNKMLCAECGSFFEDIDKVIVYQPPVQLLSHHKLGQIYIDN